MKYIQLSSMLLMIVLVLSMICYIGWSAMATGDKAIEGKTIKWNNSPFPANPPIDCTKNQGIISEGINLKAELAEQTVASGDGVTLKLTLENVDKSERSVSQTSPENDYAIFIIDPYGMSFKYESKSPTYTSRCIDHRLKQNEKITDDFVISNIRKFMGRGEYKITVGRKIPRLDGEGFADVISNTVVLTVTAPEPPTKDIEQNSPEK